MDPALAEDAQSDEQLAALAEDAISVAIEARLKEVHTCLPGIVQKFDPTTQTATVQPAIQRIFIDKGPVKLPLCVDVPVQFPAGGDFVLTFPVHANDECLLVFSERAIDFWWDRGGVQLPAEYRMHDLSDAYAIVGVSSRKRFLSNFNASGAELRTRNGSTFLRIDGSNVYVGGATGAEKAIMGETYRNAEDQYLTAIVTAVKAALSGLGLAPASATLDAAKAAFSATASSYLATKAKVL
jgi:hypothetical protein